jgi:hypothetical protein
MPSFTYRVGAGRPQLWLFWRDSNKQLIDFSDNDYSFVLKLGLNRTVVLEKTEGIAGQAGDLSTNPPVPNILISWEDGEFDDLDPGEYEVEFAALLDGGPPRFWPEDDPISIIIVAALAEPEP